VYPSWDRILFNCFGSTRLEDNVLLDHSR
jgi:hypothetical protein